MKRIFAVVVIGSTTMGCAQIVRAQSPETKDRPADLKTATESGDLTALPPIPRGKSTILGGEIRSVDPVLDQLTLKVYGERPLKIYFDERTQLFKDGKRVPLRDLAPQEHASIQTVLDDGNVFALSIHTLSQAAGGECQGQVLSYEPGTRQLTLSSSLSHDPIRLVLSEQAQVVREGQHAFTSAASGTSDLVSGSLVVVKFEADGKGQALANHVTVLALPGASFAFSGSIASLDMHAGLLVLNDPRDEKSYQIFFNPAAIPGSGNLHSGDRVRVTARLEDNRYTATEITATPSPQP